MRWAVPLHVLVLLPGTSLLILPASDDVSSPQGIPLGKPTSPSLYHYTLFISSQALAIVLSELKAGKERERYFLNTYYVPGTGLFN